MIDSNEVIRAYLVAQAGLTTLVSTRVYCPRLPENCVLPAVGFFTRGGSSSPYIPDIVRPSKQFDCWGTSLESARQVYRALYDCLQGKQNVSVVIGETTYTIRSAREEGHGIDMVDVDVPGYFRVLSFWEIFLM